MAYDADGLASLSLAAGVVALALWLGMMALRRLRGAGFGTRNDDCRIVRSLAVGSRERIVVVAIGARQLVVGVGTTSVSLLCELDAPLPAPAAAAAFGAALGQAAAQWRRQ